MNLIIIKQKQIYINNLMIYINNFFLSYFMSNKSLYEDKHPESSTKGLGFKNKQKAIDTLKIIKNRDLTYQRYLLQVQLLVYLWQR